MIPGAAAPPIVPIAGALVHRAPAPARGRPAAGRRRWSAVDGRRQQAIEAATDPDGGSGSPGIDGRRRAATGAATAPDDDGLPAVDGSAATGPTRTVAWIANVVAPAIARRAPDQRAPAVETVTTYARWNGGPVGLLVLASHQGADGRWWLRVRLPGRPVTRAGWIPADDTELVTTAWAVHVSRRQRTVALLRAGRTVRRWRAVVGAPRTPTPRGLFAVSEIVRQPQPDGFLGAWAVHLTARSRVLDDYGGGPGTVALHGRGGASLRDPLGSARSHGCVRLDNAAIRTIVRHVAPGTPVVVR